MNLESCFDFVDDSDIRIRGTRLGIETVLFDFLDGASPEEIAVRYCSLKLADVYATITYYFHHRDQVDSYLAGCQRSDEAAARHQNECPSNLVSRLRNERQEGTISAKG